MRFGKVRDRFLYTLCIDQKYIIDEISKKIIIINQLLTYYYTPGTHAQLSPSILTTFFLQSFFICFSFTFFESHGPVLFSKKILRISFPCFFLTTDKTLIFSITSDSYAKTSFHYFFISFSAHFLFFFLSYFISAFFLQYTNVHSLLFDMLISWSLDLKRLEIWQESFCQIWQ